MFERQSTDRSVILAHGITGTSRRMNALERYLSARGRRCYSIDFVPHDASIPLCEYANQLKNFIARVVGEQPIDLVAFSMGGLVAASYLQELEGADRTVTFISIATPHNGTLIANAAVWAGCRDMAYGSKFIQRLKSKRAKLASVRVVTISTPYDFVIWPSESASLPGAENYSIDVWFHHRILQDPATHRAVWAALQST